MDAVVAPPVSVPTTASSGGDNVLLYVLALAAGGVAAYLIYDWSQSKPKPKPEEVVAPAPAPVVQQPRSSAAPAASAPAPASAPPAIAAPKPPTTVKDSAKKSAEELRSALYTKAKAPTADMKVSFKDDWQEDALDVKRRQRRIDKEVES